MRASTLKSGVAAFCGAVGLTGLARRRHHGLRVLMYHGVIAKRVGPAAFGSLFLSTDDFARQMRHLKRHYDVVDLQDTARRIASRAPVPARAVAITFDDGYRNNITEALPVLAALQLPATVFVTTDLAGGDRLLWFDALRIVAAERETAASERHWADTFAAIRALPPDAQARSIDALGEQSARGGWARRHPEFALAGWNEWRDAVSRTRLRIGSHTTTHGDLRSMTEQERDDDLRRAKQRIEAELARECAAIAYPYGAWNEDVARSARTAGYSAGVTTDEGLNGLGSDALALRRTMIGDKGDVALFTARVSGLWEMARRVSQSS